MKTLHLSLAALVAVGIMGCSSSTDDVNTSSTTDTVTTYSGQLVDSYINNVTYKCGDGTEGITDTNGNFTCDTLPVEFRIGKLRLGKVDALNDDKQVFPQDLLGVDRNDTRHTEVLAMAQFLQSCDRDKDPRNGIDIDEQVVNSFTELDEEFSSTKLETYIADANLTLVNSTEAQEHLDETTEFTKLVRESKVPDAIKDSLLSVDVALDETTIQHLTYMGNEERLAYDIYNELYKLYPDIKQFTNIAMKSEAKHIQAIQLLINKYDIKDTELSTIVNPLSYANTEIEDMQTGVYDIESIQSLYDVLYAKGSQTEIDALEVGCMVEVTDINDLDKAIIDSQNIGADDVTAAFEFLRNGSYFHYWAFDAGLVSKGITDGCCSLGEIDGVNYCHPEYPTNVNAGKDEQNATTTMTDTTTITADTNTTGTQGQGPGHGQGQQKGKQ